MIYFSHTVKLNAEKLLARYDVFNLCQLNYANMQQFEYNYEALVDLNL